jgi:hypothetical protein
VRQLGGDEQAGRRIRARGHARAAADARGRVHRQVRVLLADRDRVAVGRVAARDGDVAARGDDAVEGAPVDDQVAQHRERVGAPRLDPQRVAVLEAAHVKLAGGGGAARPVRGAVDHHAARAADALAAVVVERDRLLALQDQALVDHVEQLQERHLGRDPQRRIAHEAALALGVLLAPDVERQVDRLAVSAAAHL